jgi:hypothetical protein
VAGERRGGGGDWGGGERETRRGRRVERTQREGGGRAQNRASSYANRTTRPYSRRGSRGGRGCKVAGFGRPQG